MLALSDYVAQLVQHGVLPAVWSAQGHAPTRMLEHVLGPKPPSVENPHLPTIEKITLVRLEFAITGGFPACDLHVLW